MRRFWYFNVSKWSGGKNLAFQCCAKMVGLLQHGSILHGLNSQVTPKDSQSSFDIPKYHPDTPRLSLRLPKTSPNSIRHGTTPSYGRTTLRNPQFTETHFTEAHFTERTLRNLTLRNAQITEPHFTECACYGSAGYGSACYGSACYGTSLYGYACYHLIVPVFIGPRYTWGPIYGPK